MPYKQVLDIKERKIWAALAHDIRFNAKNFAEILATGKSLNELWNLSVRALQALNISLKTIHLFLEIKQSQDPEQVFDDLVARNIEFITIKDPHYPALLREIHLPPAVLYVRGQLKQNLSSIAVVGSRKATPYGLEATQTLISPLAKAGITITSGLAFGIDAAAHLTAIKNQGQTIAVLPSGVDLITPSSHTTLAHNILETGGALISEFPPGSQSLPRNYPIRNRIIAGLTRATLVVEADIKSGSLITARCALESNRDVLAVPGPIFSQVSRGTHYLIQMGAKLITSAQDILTELGLEDSVSEQSKLDIKPQSRQEKLILETLGTGSMQFDQLAQKTRIPAQQLISTLTLMEMKEEIRNLGGTIFSKS